VKRLKNDRKKIEIITVEEVQKLFPKNWKTVWGDKEIAYIANRLASLTGMRAGEIMGLRGEYVFDDYIYVCGSYGEYGYGPTKTKETRFIPLIPEMTGLLKKTYGAQRQGLCVFSGRRGYRFKSPFVGGVNLSRKGGIWLTAPHLLVRSLQPGDTPCRARPCALSLPGL
jgi:integrase